MPSPVLTYPSMKRFWRLCLILLIGATLFYFLPSWPTDRTNVPGTTPHEMTSRICTLYPDTADIAVIMKTGAIGGLDNMSKTLSTCLSCVKDVTILSDLDQEFNGAEVHNILARWSRENMEGNPEFDVYFRQLSLQAEGREDDITAELSNIPAMERDWRTKGKKAGWALDKYKWLHMIDMAWDYQPDRKWYIFVEPDTYLSWPNLKRWLRTLDPEQKFYGGLAIQKSDDRQPLYFAQGGSSLVLSGALVKEFAVTRRGIAKKYEPRMHEWWAGDFTLADVLYDELDVKVSQMRPMVNQQYPRSIPICPDAWCQAAMGLHHMKADDFDEVFEIEREHDFSHFLLRDLYAKIYPRGLPEEILDWNNIADAHEWGVQIDHDRMPVGLEANKDYASCRTACEVHPECFSFTFLNTTEKSDQSTDVFRSMHSCFLSNAFRLGVAKAEQGFGSNYDELGTYRRWHSGWLSERISTWAREHWECKAEQEFETLKIPL